MAKGLQWWELKLPETPEDCADAWAIVEARGIRLCRLSDELDAVSVDEAVESLRVVLGGGAVDVRFPWYRVSVETEAKASAAYTGGSLSHLSLLAVLDVSSVTGGDVDALVAGG